MKKIIVLLLALIMVFSVVACDEKKPPVGSSTPNAGGDEQPKDVNIPIVEEGSSKITLVTPEIDGANWAEYARDELRWEFKDITGTTIRTGANTEGEYEILIGDTGREESKTVMESLEDDEFAIKTVGNKIVIAAKNGAFLLQAANYFIENCLTEDYAEVSDSDIVIKKSIDVKENGDAEDPYYILATSGEDMLEADIEVALTLKNDKYIDGVGGADDHYRRQGGCYNGKAYYQALITQDEKLCIIAKKDVKTGEVTYSEPRNLGHANDMTYNSKTNQILVGFGEKVALYDADTLEYQTVKSLSGVGTTGRMGYNETRNQYVFSSFKIYSGTLSNTNKTFPDTKASGHTSQGLAVDDHFIYSLLMKGVGNSKYKCYVAVYDWSGNLLTYMQVKIPNNDEPENISVVDGEIYIAACTPHPTATLYKVTFQAPNA